jgi:hypothetical protein
MTQSLNFKKILQEDEKFRDYAKEVALIFAMSNPQQSNMLLATIYSFYQMNASLKDIQIWARNINLANELDNQK